MKVAGVIGGRRRWLLIASLFAMVACSAALATLVLDLDAGRYRPDFYDSERSALVEAEWQLSRAIEHGRKPAAEDVAAQRVGNVIDLLQKAQQGHPEHRRRLQHIHDMLDRLQAAEHEVHDLERRRIDLYRRIVDEIDNLIVPNAASRPIHHAG